MQFLTMGIFFGDFYKKQEYLPTCSLNCNKKTKNILQLTLRMIKSSIFSKISNNSSIMPSLIAINITQLISSIKYIFEIM